MILSKKLIYDKKKTILLKVFKQFKRLKKLEKNFIFRKHLNSSIKIGVLILLISGNLKEDYPEDFNLYLSINKIDNFKKNFLYKEN